MRLVLVCFVLPAVLASTSIAIGSDGPQLLRRAATAWSEYQDMQVKGTLTRIQNGETLQRQHFVVSVGRADDPKKCPPMEVGFVVPNPGEPHLAGSEIFDAAGAFNGEYCGFFKRRYVSQSPHEARMSTVMLDQSVQAGIEWPVAMIWNSVLAGIDGMDPRFAHPFASEMTKNITLEQLGSEKFLGHDAIRVRITHPFGPASQGDFYPPLQTEALVVSGPTFQGVKVISISGGSDGYSEVAFKRAGEREVQSLRLMDRWLLCDRIRWGTDEHYYLVELHEAKQLSNDYVGTWEFDSITGADFSGSLEQATRKGSPRQVYRHTKHVTYIPYTKEEQSKIRKYILSQAVPANPKINWLTVGFLVTNVIAGCFLGWFAYTRYFAKRLAIWLLCLSGLAASAHAADSPPNATNRDPIQIPSVPLAVSTYDGYCGIAAVEYVASRFGR